MFDLPACRAEDLTVQTPEESAAVIRSVFDGREGPARNIVAANAAVAFHAVGRTTALQEGIALANATIDEGEAMRLLEQFAEFTHGL